jgi:hypothetical protein
MALYIDIMVKKWSLAARIPGADMYIDLDMLETTHLIITLSWLIQ